MSNFEKFNDELPSKGKFYISLPDKFLNVWNKFETKTIQDYHNLYLKSDVLFLADVLEFRNDSLKIMYYVQVII